MTEGRKWTQEEKQGEMAERKWRKGGGGGDGNRGGRNEGGQRLRKRIREGKGQGQVKKKKKAGRNKRSPNRDKALLLLPLHAVGNCSQQASRSHRSTIPQLYACEPKGSKSPALAFFLL